MRDGLLRDAYALHRAGNLAEAVRLYGEVLQGDPQNYDAMYLLGFAQLQAGRFADSDRTLSVAMRLKPTAPDAPLARGIALQRLGRHGEAIACYDVLLAIKPDHHEGWHNRGVALIMLGRYDEARSDLDKAVSLKPDYPDGFEHRGIAHAMLGRYEQAAADYDSAIRLGSGSAEIYRRRGDAGLQLERFSDALADYERAVALNPEDADAWHNRGVVLSRLKRPEGALSSYERALAIRPGFAESWSNRGSALLELKRHADALASYERALKIRPDWAEGWKNHGVVLLGLQRYADAIADFERAVELNPDFAEAWEQKGTAFSRLLRYEDALASYDRAFTLNPSSIEVLASRANTLASLARFEEAVESCQALLKRAPDYPYAKGLLMHCRLHSCDWRELEAARTEIAADLIAGKRVIPPFGNIAISESPADQLRCAEIRVADTCPPALTPLWRGERYRHDRIRIAYLSADMRVHAVAFLVVGVFEEHDKSRFELTGVSLGPDDKSDIRARITHAFDRFIDARGLGDADVATQLRELEIDIAVDLTGFTQASRPGILSHRFAPVQVNYLGYPGTVGAPYLDYIIADRTVIPEAEKRFYREKVVYLPHAYQCNDNKRGAGATPTRREAGLPEAGFVFCCFNNNYKILPGAFDAWMRILRRVPESVLWLLEDNATAVENLKREAEKRGIARERLIFAARARPVDHLARQPLADLVLDTLPYGAHTTASDALWMGVPVLTKIGTTFAGRVAASLLRAAGLPELVTESYDEFEDLAVALAQDREKLANLKAGLKRDRGTAPLFDTQSVTRHLEAIYSEMLRRHQEGRAPEPFAIDDASRVVA
jgi:predicted O-linked N-acetylglucosamine transferase (SPINDLY family)